MCISCRLCSIMYACFQCPMITEPTSKRTSDTPELVVVSEFLTSIYATNLQAFTSINPWPLITNTYIPHTHTYIPHTHTHIHTTHIHTYHTHTYIPHTAASTIIISRSIGYTFYLSITIEENVVSCSTEAIWNER